METMKVKKQWKLIKIFFFKIRKRMAFDQKWSNKGRDGWEKKANALGKNLDFNFASPFLDLSDFSFFCRKGGQDPECEG